MGKLGKLVLNLGGLGINLALCVVMSLPWILSSVGIFGCIAVISVCSSPVFFLVAPPPVSPLSPPLCSGAWCHPLAPHMPACVTLAGFRPRGRDGTLHASHNVVHVYSI